MVTFMYKCVAINTYKWHTLMYTEKISKFISYNTLESSKPRVERFP